MPQNYLGHFSIKPNMPNNMDVEEFINLTVEFNIICPNCGPKKHKIKKNGFDRKLKSKPQKFYCHKCEKTFFAHTSWIFKEFSNLIVEKILDDLFVNNLRPKDIVKNYNISNSFVTKIRHLCFDILKKKVTIVKNETNKLSELNYLPLEFQSAIWWDETFFKINGSSYCLILIINGLGEVLGYKFSKTRSEHDFLSILEPIKDRLPEVPIFIGDGCPTYERVVKKLRKESFLIQHIHSHPWKEAKIHHFISSDLEDEMIQLTLQIPFDSFINNERVTGYAMKRKTLIKKDSIFKRKRGRRKGQKDTKKRVKYGTRKEQMIKRKLKKRGRKDVKKEGLKFSFDPQPSQNGWSVVKESTISKRSNLLNPGINEIEKALSVTYKIMNGGSIQSNFIESKNNVVKQFLSGRGLKNIYQYDYLLGAHLLARGDLDSCYWDDFNNKISFRKSLGFTHMLDFFTPDLAKLEIY